MLSAGGCSSLLSCNHKLLSVALQYGGSWLLEEWSDRHVALDRRQGLVYRLRILRDVRRSIGLYLLDVSAHGWSSAISKDDPSI